MNPYRVQVWRVLDKPTGAGEWTPTTHTPANAHQGTMIVEMYARKGERARLTGPGGQVIVDSGAR